MSSIVQRKSAEQILAECGFAHAGEVQAELARLRLPRSRRKAAAGAFGCGMTRYARQLVAAVENRDAHVAGVRFGDLIDTTLGRQPAERRIRGNSA